MRPDTALLQLDRQLQGGGSLAARPSLRRGLPGVVRRFIIVLGICMARRRRRVQSIWRASSRHHNGPCHLDEPHDGGGDARRQHLLLPPSAAVNAALPEYGAAALAASLTAVAVATATTAVAVATATATTAVAVAAFCNAAPL